MAKEIVVSLSIQGEVFDLTVNDAIRLKNAIEEALDWAPGWSTMIFVPMKNLPLDVLN